MIPTTPPVIAPSLLAADFRHLESDINHALKGGTNWLHCDIMDGHFVPNISFGPMVVEATRETTDAFLDVHLMIEKPERYIPVFADSGANLITVHIETCPHVHQTLQMIRDQGCHTGVAVNPGTSLTTVQAILEDIDMVLLMTVNPGFGGQKFIEASYDRLRELLLMRKQQNNKFLIQVDGGVNGQNTRKIAAAGADVLVAGSYVFNSNDISGTVSHLRNDATSGYRSDDK